MARGVTTYKQPSIVSGMTIDDIMNMDIDTFNKLNVSDLRKVVGRLVSAGNKRIRRLEKAGYSTPATVSVERSGGDFSTKGKDVNQLRAEYIRIRNFMNAKTSTVSGYKKFMKEFESEMGFSFKDIHGNDAYWRILGRLEETDPSFYSIYYRELMEELHRIMSESGGVNEYYAEEDIDEMLNKLTAFKTEKYEEMESDILNNEFFPI